MLHDPDRHEPLRTIAWDDGRARQAIERIVHDTVQAFRDGGWWRIHPRDVEAGDDPAQPAWPLYFGAAGTVWALQYLDRAGAARCDVAFDDRLGEVLQGNRVWLAAAMPQGEPASYLCGDTPILMMLQGLAPTAERADRLAALIEGNLEHPARELMWGAPGTMLAALFLHRRFGDERWAALFRASAARLRAQLLWSDERRCHYWAQDFHGGTSTYIDAVHGFVGTAAVLLRGRDLLDAGDWTWWARTIAKTVERTALREGHGANWPAMLNEPAGRVRKRLMQFCHGSPGFVIALAPWPDAALNDLLVAGGEATWAAGPLTKGSNLCHGTGGNGYAFLHLHARTGDARWLDRARAFAMHGIAQTEDEARRHGRLRPSLWTGDPGFAIYLWDCIRARPAFPTLDAFWADSIGVPDERAAMPGTLEAGTATDASNRHRSGAA